MTEQLDATDGRDDSQGRGLWAGMRRHPVITRTMLICTVVGAVAGFIYLDADGSALRRIAAGAVAGGGTGLLMTATKMIG